MFFIFAKLLWFFLQPTALIACALIAGTLLTFTARKRLARTLLLGAIAAYLAAGVTPLADILYNLLEQRFPRADLDRVGAPVTGMIVLGGVEETHSYGSPDVGSLGESAERFTEAIVLARRFPEARLVFSGGSGSLTVPGPPEAEMAQRVFVALGIRAERITLEKESRDTCENAAFTARLIKREPGQRWLLVTSAWHMPRAMGCFRRVGFPVEAWPVDYRAPQRLTWVRWNNLMGDGLQRTDGAVHEYVGLLAYYLAGRIDTLFPAP